MRNLKRMKVCTCRLCLAMLLSSCGIKIVIKKGSDGSDVKAETGYSSIANLYDEKFLSGLQKDARIELDNCLQGTDYKVKNIKVVFHSRSYIQSLEYNSRENIYYGFTLSELEEKFQGKPFMFNVDENGRTVVEELKGVSVYDLNTMVRNYAIGAGTIVVCITLSAATGGAASVVFATAAENALKQGVITATIVGVARGGITYYNTGDKDEAIFQAKMGASEGFKWGAICGAVSGGQKGWKNSLGVRNKIAGTGREQKVLRELSKSYPASEGYKVMSECYLRDSTGKILTDPLTGAARRIDHVLTQDGRIVKMIEVTSKTADKTAQIAKEKAIRNIGGNFIKDPETGTLMRIPDGIETIIERLE